jgi:hypothetical protein
VSSTRNIAGGGRNCPDLGDHHRARRAEPVVEYDEVAVGELAVELGLIEPGCGIGLGVGIVAILDRGRHAADDRTSAR